MYKNENENKRINEIKIENRPETDPFKILQHFKFEFIDKPKQLNKRIVNSSNNFNLDINVRNAMFLDLVPEPEIYKIILGLKKFNS